MQGIDVSNKVAAASYKAVPPKITANRRSAESSSEKQTDSSRITAETVKVKKTDVVDFVEKTPRNENSEDGGHKPDTQQTTQQAIQQAQKLDKEAVEKANTKLKAINKMFEFSVHEGTNQIVVKVKNSETNEIIREIPSEKVLDMLANICEVAGLLVDEKR